MDPNAFVYRQRKNKLELIKIKKLKKGDKIVSITKDWNVIIVTVTSIEERIFPPICLSKMKFKNGMELITTDYQRLLKLYDVPYNEDEPLCSGTYMTFEMKNNVGQLGMTELSSIEGLDHTEKYLVRVLSLNCEDDNNNLINGIIVNGVPVNSFNLC